MEFDNGKNTEAYLLLAAGVCPHCYCKEVDFVDVGQLEVGTCPQCNTSYGIDHENKKLRSV